MNQKTRLFDHMMEGNSLTQRSALMDFNVMALPRRIADIKEAGYELTTRIETNNHTGQPFARYFMTAAQIDENRERRNGTVYWFRIEPKDMTPGDVIHFLGASRNWGGGFTGSFVNSALDRARDQFNRAIGQVEEVMSDGTALISFSGVRQKCSDASAHVFGMEFAIKRGRKSDYPL